MCGIAGYVQRVSSPHHPIERMTARLAHRGPDGQGIWQGRCSGADGEWEIALGHRRLSIIDPAGGHEPLSNEDGTVWITYNGEVYNFRELQRDLERRGHRFNTRCDTEAIVHHYEEHGEGGLPDLHGMFAFAIWDGRASQLLLARDRIGVKPLYYAPLPDGGVAFASELTALLEHPAVDRSLDPQGVASLFFLDYVHPPHTMVRGARKLEPGHALTWSAPDGLREPRAFWCLSPGGETASGETELTGLLRDKLAESVRAQLISDVPLGVFLSGGIDSSLVAAVATAQREGAEPLKTFSIAFEDPAFDESRYARRVAEHLKTRHFERTLSEADLLATVDRALDCLDEPIGDPSIVPTYLLSRLASEHVKVALGGDGGDELWAGYPTYVAHRYAVIYQRLPRLARAKLIEPLVRRLPVRHGYQSLEWKLKRFALRWDDRPLARHLRWMSNTDLPELRNILSDDSAETLAQRLSSDAGADAGLNRILALDLTTYLPGAVLTKVDRASMAHGLEVRPPMLDDRLVDFAFSIPAPLKLRGRQTKALLKRAASGLLPDEIIHRPKKGFAIPQSRWLQGPLKAKLESSLADGPLWRSGLLRRQTLHQWFAEHQRGQIDRSKPLWALLVLSHWANRV